MQRNGGQLMKPIRTWVLIADGARARILENDGPGHGLKAVDGMVFSGDHSATHDLVSDREGRSQSSNGPGRSAIESHSDPHRELKVKFAQHLADVLDRELDTKSFHRLVVVAPPVTLGDLRSLISQKVRTKIIGEVAQDLTKIPNADVGGHINEILIT
jgi:protein required for attachment to host cells